MYSFPNRNQKGESHAQKIFQNCKIFCLTSHHVFRWAWGKFVLRTLLTHAGKIT